MNLRATAIAPFVAAMLINGLNNGFGLPQNTVQGNQHNRFANVSAVTQGTMHELPILSITLVENIRT